MSNKLWDESMKTIIIIGLMIVLAGCGRLLDHETVDDIQEMPGTLPTGATYITDAGNGWYTFAIAVVLGVIVTYALPGDGSHPTLLEALLTMLAFGLFCLGIYQTIIVLIHDYEQEKFE